MKRTIQIITLLLSFAGLASAQEGSWMVWDVLPGLATSDLAHVGLVNPVSFRDDALKLGRFSDGNNFGFGEFAKRILGSSKFLIPSFGSPISGVISSRTNPKMARVAAGRIIAMVADAQPVRNIAISDLESDAMRLPDLLIDSERSVAIFVSSSCPEPALIGPTTGNLAPETFWQAFFGSKIPSSHYDLLGVLMVRDDAGLNPRFVPSTLALRS